MSNRLFNTAQKWTRSSPCCFDFFNEQKNASQLHHYQRAYSLTCFINCYSLISRHVVYSTYTTICVKCNHCQKELVRSENASNSLYNALCACICASPAPLINVEGCFRVCLTEVRLVGVFQHCKGGVGAINNRKIHCAR